MMENFSLEIMKDRTLKKINQLIKKTAFLNVADEGNKQNSIYSKKCEKNESISNK